MKQIGEIRYYEGRISGMVMIGKDSLLEIVRVLNELVVESNARSVQLESDSVK